MERLEHEPDVGPPHPGQGPLPHRVHAPPRQPHLATRGPVQAAQQVQQRGLPAATGPHHRHRLARGDIEVDAVDGAHQSLSLAVVLAQPTGPQHRCVVGVCHDLLLRPVQVCSHASSQRRSACSRSTMPSNNSAASEPIRLGHRGALGVAQPAQQLAALRVHDAERVGQPGRRRRHQLEMELRQVGLGPTHLRQPLGDPLLAVGGQHVHLAVRPVRQPFRPVGGHQPRLLQPAQGDVDLPGVQGLPQRAQRVAQPRPQLVAVRGLLGQHRQHHFLLHRLSDLTVSPKITAIPEVGKPQLTQIAEESSLGARAGLVAGACLAGG